LTQSELCSNKSADLFEKKNEWKKNEWECQEKNESERWKKK